MFGWCLFFKRLIYKLDFRLLLTEKGAPARALTLILVDFKDISPGYKIEPNFACPISRDGIQINAHIKYDLSNGYLNYSRSLSMSARA